jgi:hypothetical protein
MLSGKLRKEVIVHLHRVTPDPFENYSYHSEGKFLGQPSEGFEVTTWGFTEGELFVVASFPRFGGGKKRASDFEVGVTWKDVEAIIEKFCEASKPEAVALQEAVKLATAARELGWRPPDNTLPQSN